MESKSRNINQGHLKLRTTKEKTIMYTIQQKIYFKRKEKDDHYHFIPVSRVKTFSLIHEILTPSEFESLYFGTSFPPPIT